MNKPQASAPRARLQALRAIPERDRTEAEWDELNELEIMLASENRQTSPGQQPMPRDGNAPQGHGNQGHGNPGHGSQGHGNQGHGNPGHQKPRGGAPQGQQPERKFHKRPRRRKTP